VLYVFSVGGALEPGDGGSADDALAIWRHGGDIFSGRDSSLSFE
jgi:hypothetical protein